MNMFNTQHISENYGVKSLPVTEMPYDGVAREELVNLLDTLQRQVATLSISPRKVILEHAIQICQSYLNNLLDCDWHKHLYEQARTHNKGLNEQLSLMLKLLDHAHLPISDSSPNTHSAANPDENKIFTEAWQHIDHWMNIKAPEKLDHTSDDAHTPKVVEPKIDHTGDLDVYFFGAFRVYRNGKLINCLSKSRAKQLLKYLILNRGKAIPKEVLMDRFWPDHDESSARNNLNVAVYCLRQALKVDNADYVHVLFQDGCYFLNNRIQIQVDTETFEQHVKAADRLEAQGKTAEAIEQYSRAENLYKSDFLVDDLYEDWSLELREHYKALYVKLLGKLSNYYYQERALDACIAVNRKITSVEMGDEHAHRRLMECFARLNQRHLALRQYQLCSDILAKEFGLRPSQETMLLYKYIKAQESPENHDGELAHRKQA